MESKSCKLGSQENTTEILLKATSSKMLRKIRPKPQQLALARYYKLYPPSTTCLKRYPIQETLENTRYHVYN